MIKVQNIEVIISFFKQAVVERWDMFCDDRFFNHVVTDMLEVFDREDLDDPTMQWDLSWDGEVEATFSMAVDGSIVLQINPQYRDPFGERVTITSCTVGELQIDPDKWAGWLRIVDENSSLED